MAVSNAEADAASLAVDGYCVHRRALAMHCASTQTSIAQWRELAMTGEPIFNAGDELRTQAPLPSTDELVALAQRLAPSPALRADDWVVLASHAGAAAQPAHADWDPRSFFVDAAPADTPCGLLIALGPGASHFDVWPGSWRDVRASIALNRTKNKASEGEDEDEDEDDGPQVSPEDRRRVRLGAGDAVVFRGDLVHGGADWPRRAKTPNVRLHAYLDAPGLVRPENYTFRAATEPGDTVCDNVPDTVPDPVPDRTIH